MKTKLERIDYFLIILGLILLSLPFIFNLNPDLGTLLSLNMWTGESISFNLGSGLIAVSVACFLGALVPFPVPYVLVVSIVAFQLWETEIAVLSVILVITISTITNMIGDLLDYFIGLGAGKLKESSKNATNAEKKKESPKQSKSNEENRWAKIIYSRPKLIPYVVFLFGCTPLPDSLLLMPLGVVKYDFKKMILWSTIGKFIMMTVVSIFGILGFNALLALFGGDNWIFGIVILYLSYLMIVVMIKFD
ncbi:MAG: VTT domain-containing protein [Promethearchaeota archaeon]